MQAGCQMMKQVAAFDAPVRRTEQTAVIMSCYAIRVNYPVPPGRKSNERPRWGETGPPMVHFRPGRGCHPRMLATWPLMHRSPITLCPGSLESRNPLRLYCLAYGASGCFWGIDSIRPSFMRTTRSANPITMGSWLAATTVVFCSRHSLPRISMISLPVR